MDLFWFRRIWWAATGLLLIGALVLIGYLFARGKRKSALWLALGTLVATPFLLVLAVLVGLGDPCC